MEARSRSCSKCQNVFVIDITVSKEKKQDFIMKQTDESDDLIDITEGTD